MKHYSVLVLLALAANVSAKKAPNHQTELLLNKASIQNQTKGADVLLSNINSKVSGHSVEEKALNFLQQSKSFESVSSMGGYVHSATSVGKATTTVRFKQQLNGYPVYGSDIAITINQQDHVVFAAGEVKQISESVESKSAVSDFLAHDIARNFLGFSYQAKLLKSEQVAVINDQGKARIAYRYIMTDPAKLGEWEVLVAEDNAEILMARDMAHYAQVAGTASAFDPDPLSTAGVTYGATGYTDGNDASTPQLQAEIYEKNVMVEQTGGSFKLQSPFAEIVENEAPNNGLFLQNSADFTFNRFDAGFEAANVYYHIDTYMRYLNNDLGVPVMPYQYSGGVQFDPHGLNGADNSYYTSSSGRVVFGEGGVDDSEDADVIIHELGHGLHDWLTVGGLSQVNGLSEGLGDYVANSYARKRDDFQWTYLDDEYYWVFSWDGHNQFWNGRRTNSSSTYPSGLGGGVHSDGQIWSTCLMKIWDQIGVRITDTVVLEGIRMTSSGTNQPQAAQAVLQAAFNLNYYGQLPIIESTFESCGYTVNGFNTDLIFADGYQVILN